ncbi:SdpI family protein [Thermaerobacter sp. FW80]|uniref:SdpI family protein n=1 Tax=Thermaerobacter sp. FW80 TaxID=2546351 RepID=UPI001FA946A5|nr:SdpI family protein [Thermaerobacter sp. FW80]
MGQVRPNFFFGIRTPWTLSSEAVWRKTHRAGAGCSSSRGWPSRRPPSCRPAGRCR